MSSKYQSIQWVVQQNLTSKEDFDGLKKACEKLCIPFTGINIVPFSSELPEFDRQKQSIPYGSTTFNALAYQDEILQKGLFFDEVTFSIQNYFDKWGAHMLNLWLTNMYVSRVDDKQQQLLAVVLIAFKFPNIFRINCPTSRAKNNICFIINHICFSPGSATSFEIC